MCIILTQRRLDMMRYDVNNCRLSNLGLHIVKILSCSYFELQLFLSNFWYSNGKMRSSSF